MSQAGKSFEQAIKDAEGLLARFDEENNQEVKHNSEALKRAGMVIAMAAWETYVKDRFREEISFWLSAIEGSTLANYVNRKANEEMKRFFNPNSEKTKKLFIEFFDVDVTKSWNWDNYQSPQAKKMLNSLISKRGEAAHVAKTELHSPDSIKRNDLDKTIRFLKGLVTSMEQQKIVIPFL